MPTPPKTALLVLITAESLRTAPRTFSKSTLGLRRAEVQLVVQQADETLTEVQSAVDMDQVRAAVCVPQDNAAFRGVRTMPVSMCAAPTTLGGRPRWLP